VSCWPSKRTDYATVKLEPAAAGTDRGEIVICESRLEADAVHDVVSAKEQGRIAHNCEAYYQAKCIRRLVVMDAAEPTGSANPEPRKGPRNTGFRV
jgi:hypothetical protein